MSEKLLIPHYMHKTLNSAVYSSGAAMRSKAKPAVARRQSVTLTLNLLFSLFSDTNFFP